MHSELKKKYVKQIIEQQDENGCWNVLAKSDKHYPRFNYYVPNYKSTLWTLVVLADVKIPVRDLYFHRPLQTISDHFYDQHAGIYSLGKSHFPIPCLNGNMLYLHGYFRLEKRAIIENIIDFFNTYQRFDDGDFKTPSSFPYCSNRSCYGKHTCYWGVVKLLKGLSFILARKRSKAAKELVGKCIDFILLHNVCYRSHKNSEYLHKTMQYLTFPNMYRSDFLEILWLLKREQVTSPRMAQALELLRNKQQNDKIWKIERAKKELLVPLPPSPFGNELVTERAREVNSYYTMI
jgi:hypothetical protein